MPKFIDLTGRIFGKLTVIERGEDFIYQSGSHRPVPRWVCECACGKRELVLGGALRGGNTKSCGCGIGEAQRKHGHRPKGKRSPEYASWGSAKERCFNPGNDMFQYYGARGITMCDEWREDFARFLKDMGHRPPGTSLDRIDYNGNYEPGNCRWLPMGEQQKNRRTVVMITFDGRTQCLADWARELGLPYPTLRDWHKYQGVPFAEIVSRARARAQGKRAA